MKLVDKLTCPHPDNYDYHSGYQQALIDVQRLLEAKILIEHNLAEERGLKRDIALARLAEMRDALRWLRNEAHPVAYLYQDELRQAICNTAVTCLQAALERADEVLSACGLGGDITDEG